MANTWAIALAIFLAAVMNASNPAAPPDAIQQAAAASSGAAGDRLLVGASGAAIDIADLTGPMRQSSPVEDGPWESSLEEVPWDGGGGCRTYSQRELDALDERYGGLRHVNAPGWIIGLYEWDRSMKVGDLYNGVPITWMNENLGAIQVIPKDELAFLGIIAEDPNVEYCDPNTHAQFHFVARTDPHYRNGDPGHLEPGSTGSMGTDIEGAWASDPAASADDAQVTMRPLTSRASDSVGPMHHPSSLEEVEWDGESGCVPPSPREQVDPNIPRREAPPGIEETDPVWLFGLWEWDRNMKVGDNFHGHPITWLNEDLGAIAVEVAAADLPAFLETAKRDANIEFCEPNGYAVLHSTGPLVHQVEFEN